MCYAMTRIASVVVFVAIGTSMPFVASGQGTQVDPSNFQFGNSFLEGAERARRERMQEEQLRLERERANADTALREEQRRAIQLENDQRELELQQQSQQAPIDPRTVEVLNRWAANASKRSSQFPDFDRVVFAPDVAITLEMIQLMADSQYAADIAYYLGKNQTRSYQIAAMPLLQQATEIAEIEKLVRLGPKAD